MSSSVHAVAAIIVTYNGGEWIKKCVESLIHSSIPIDVIIVDNGSTDDTLSLLKTFGDQVHIASNDKNLGFGQGNNLGISIALSRANTHFFLLNQDAWVETDTIEELLKKQVEAPEYGILSPIHLNGAKTKLDFDFSKYISPDKCPGLVSDRFLDSVHREIYPIQFVNAAAWLVSAEFLNKVGGFSPVFYHYSEDNNLIDRAFHHGYRVGIVPWVTICHDREFRDYSSESYDQKDLFIRKLKVKMSDPALKKVNIYSLVLMQFFSSGKNLSLAGIRLLFWKVKSYHKIKKEVYQVKELTRSEGLHFIS